MKYLRLALLVLVGLPLHLIIVLLAVPFFCLCIVVGEKETLDELLTLVGEKMAQMDKKFIR
jgi:hypothetical protein